jgi:hypothetical protein
MVLWQLIVNKDIIFDDIQPISNIGSYSEALERE